MQDKKDIKILSPIYGFELGAIITPENTLYDQFRIWAELASTTTEGDGKAAIICAFVGEEPKDDSLSNPLQWKIAEKKIKEMTSEEEITVFTKGDDRQVIINAVTRRLAEINGGKATE